MRKITDLDQIDQIHNGYRGCFDWPSKSIWGRWEGETSREKQKRDFFCLFALFTCWFFFQFYFLLFDITWFSNAAFGSLLLKGMEWVLFEFSFRSCTDCFLSPWSFPCPPEFSSLQPAACFMNVCQKEWTLQATKGSLITEEHFCFPKETHLCMWRTFWTISSFDF